MNRGCCSTTGGVTSGGGGEFNFKVRLPPKVQSLLMMTVKMWAKLVLDSWVAKATAVAGKPVTLT